MGTILCRGFHRPAAAACHTACRRKAGELGEVRDWVERMEGLGARLEELQREQGRRVAVCPLPAFELDQAREDQLAGAVTELEQELRAAKEVKEDAMQCVLAARQGKEAAEERVREERARLQVMGLLYSCCINYPQASLDLGHAHPGHPCSRLCNAHISTGTGHLSSLSLQEPRAAIFEGLYL